MKPYLLVSVIALALVSISSVHAQSQNRAGVVVQFSDGSVTTRCVAFSEESITGYDLLRRARVPIAVEFGSFGVAVCKIGNEGCAFPNEPCFCQCQTLGAGCTYWAYSQLRDGAWTISGLGAGARQVRDGDVDGWAWGKGDGNAGIVPTSVMLDQICSAGAVAAVQPTAEATSTSLPSTDPPATEPSPVAAPSATTEPSPTNPNPSAMTATRELAATTAPAPAISMPTPLATSSPQPVTDNDPLATNALGYVVFGAIAVGLLGILALVRRSGGKP